VLLIYDHRLLKLSALQLALLAATDRMKHVNEVILPKIAQGYTVVSDRYVFSTYAYMSARGADLDWLMEINKFAPIPDMTFYIDHYLLHFVPSFETR
jgi:dTMP kinase